MRPTRDSEQQDIVRDLHGYKERIREIQVQLIELMAAIDMDTYRRDRITEDNGGISK